MKYSKTFIIITYIDINSNDKMTLINISFIDTDCFLCCFYRTVIRTNGRMKRRCTEFKSLVAPHRRLNYGEFHLFKSRIVIIKFLNCEYTIFHSYITVFIVDIGFFNSNEFLGGFNGAEQWINTYLVRFIV